MPAVPEWDVLLRGGVLRALSQRGCRSGWTVSNFRGHRKQRLLPYPWESDQLEAIRDGVVRVYEALQNGAPLQLAIAELGAAKAVAEARRQAEALACQMLFSMVLATALRLVTPCQTAAEWLLLHRS